MIYHLFDIIIPFFVFMAVIIIGLWTRVAIRKWLIKSRQNIRWVFNLFVLEIFWNSFIIWFILLSAYIAVEISIIPSEGKKLISLGLASLFVLSFVWTFISWINKLIQVYIGKTEALRSLVPIVQIVVRIVIIIIGLLILFELWGMPTLPITIIIVAGLFILVFVFRNGIDKLLGGLEIAYGEHIKVGHLIKLGTGEMGHVSKISWMRTTIQTDDGKLVIIPNDKLMANIIVNHGAVDNETNNNYVPQIDHESKTEGFIDALSNREREVLKLIGRGATNHEIAESLNISEHTVKSHLRSILNKINLRNRQQAAAYAARIGL